jgi:predicted DCC family thiol-disulfide oxidoreductase YuxK
MHCVPASGRAYLKSYALYLILSELPGWRRTPPLRFISRPIRDAVYDLSARNRYGWFGRLDSCVLPEKECANPSQ